MKWISVKERLPKVGEIVLLFSGVLQNELYEFDEYEGKRYWCREELESAVFIKESDYWMPLPEPPTAYQPKSCEGCEHKVTEILCTKNECRNYDHYQPKEK